jgi:peptidyl-dipeptidase Dcp
LPLTTEQATLEKNSKDFLETGCEEDKLKLREIDTECKIKLTYGENVLAETNNYQLHITNEADLKAPDGAKEMAQVCKKELEAGFSP